MATDTATPSVCAACKEFLKVGNVTGNSIKWAEKQPSLGSLLDAVSTNTAPLTIVVAKVQAFRNSKLCKGNCLELMPIVFEEMFRMPQIWWSEWCKKSGGYFGSQDTFNDKFQLDGHNVWFRYDVKQTKKLWTDKGKGKDYTWWKTNVFIRWDAVTGRTIVMILDPIPLLEEELLGNRDGIVQLIDKQSLAQMSQTSSPYYIASLFMEAAVHIHDKAVWGIRDLVRNIEKERETKTFHDPTSSNLHPGMRHTIHVTEMLDTMMTISTQMLEAHNQFIDENLVPMNASHEGEPGTLNKTPVNVINRQVVSRLRNASVALRTLLHRAQANESRLKNEVSLAAHVISTQIAESARVDNSVMKTLGYLGTAFLPATFIAALFSMSFFGTDQQNNWIWHPEMWYYFVVTVPLTFIVMLCTWWIHPTIKEQREKHKEAKRLAEEERKRQEAESGRTNPDIFSRTVTGLTRTVTGLTKVGGKMARPRKNTGGQPVDILNMKEKTSAPASFVVVMPEQPQTQQQPHSNSATFAPRSPPFPGSPGTADRGFMGSMDVV